LHCTEVQLDKVKDILAYGWELWRENLPIEPEFQQCRVAREVLYTYDGKHAVSLAGACESFWLFRRLHEMAQAHPIYSTLIGDYFFSLFSKCLIELDNVEVTDKFAKLLTVDTFKPISAEEYLNFVRGLQAVLS